MSEKSGKQRSRPAKHKLEVLKDKLASRLQPMPIKALTPSSPRPEPT